MILKELNLVNFGKFSREKIAFKDGLNIIYGENESGKSTIHNFIDGMFYGFLKPNVTRRYYFDEYEKYRPWNGNQYTGVLRFLKGDKTYRIDRNFAEGEVSVYDDLTGSDITKDIDTGDKIKVHLPGIYFFDFNTTIYRNTISIRQLENKIDSSLSKEVKDRLANMSTSLDDDISVRVAISNLDKKLEDIGTERAYTRPYGRSIKKLKHLKDSRKELLEKKNEYNSFLDESFIFKRDIEKLKEDKKGLEKELEKSKILHKKKTYEEGLELRDNIKGIEYKVDEYKLYSHLSFDDYTKALELERDINHLSKTIEDFIVNIDKIESNLNLIGEEDDSKTLKGIDVDILFNNYTQYDELEDKKNESKINSNKNRLHILYSEKKILKDKKKQTKTLEMCILLLSLLFLGLGIVNILFPVLAIPSVIIYFYIRGKNKKNIDDMVKVRESIEELENKEKYRIDNIDFIKKEQQEILIKYNCNSKSELKRLYDNSYMDIRDKRSKRIKIKELKNQKQGNIMRLKEKKNEKSSSVNRMKELIASNKSETLKEFKDGLNKKRKYEDLTKDKKNKAEILNKVLGDWDLEYLHEELESYDVSYLDDTSSINREDVLKKMKNQEEILSSKNKENARLEERIDNLNKSVKKLMQVEEEIYKIEDNIKEFENERRSINLAKTTIESISENIHNEFAPIINKNVSEIMDQITDGRYNKIRIDDELNIAVENPMTEEIIDLDSLSGGTIDQLYFALRFSIMGSVKGERLPLILDDAFIQYDKSRLENILKLLYKISKEKQILLFTCHYREKEILDDLELEYNLVNL